MERIYSKIQTDILLHIVYRVGEIKGRTNISPDNEFLQVASMKMNKGQTFKAHKHIKFKKTTDIAQESWLVIRGSVKCILYDLDDSIISEHILFPGDLSLTFRGGHNYYIMEDDTIVYEYKTGPYMGIENDKVFLKNQ